MRSTDNEFTTDNEVTDNIVDKAEDFLLSIPERIEEVNYEISTFFLGSVSSLKRKNLIHKKEKNILSTLSNILDVKLNNIYQFSIKANVNFMPMNKMSTKSWSSFAKVFYGIRKNKNSDLATLVLNEK